MQLRPTVFAAVPQIYDRFADGIRTVINSGEKGGLVKKLFFKGLAAKSAVLEGKGSSYCCIYDKIFAKVAAGIGFDRVRIMVTGGSKISKETMLFVRCVFGPIVNGYGATETAAAACLTLCNDFTCFEDAHVGPPMAHTTIRLRDAKDFNYLVGDEKDYKDEATQAKFKQGAIKNGGEILIRGVGVSPGYWDPSVDAPGTAGHGRKTNGMAAKNATDFIKDASGELNTFCTGDLGVMNQVGTLSVQGRLKCTFKLANGEYVASERLENEYKQSEFLDFVYIPPNITADHIAIMCVVAGPDARTGKDNNVRKWAEANGMAGKDIKEIVASEKFRARLLADFTARADEKKLKNFERIRDASKIFCEYSEAYPEGWKAGVEINGHKEELLTQTMKSKSKQLDMYFAATISTIYGAKK